MILKSFDYVKVKVGNYSLSNMLLEKLVTDLLNICSNDVLIVKVCGGISSRSSSNLTGNIDQSLNK